MQLNPMHQFEVYRIGPEIKFGVVNLSFTNASLFMTISAVTILLLLFFGTKKKLLIPSKLQLITEMSYTFIAKMINDTAGSNAKAFFPFIFTSEVRFGLHCLDIRLHFFWIAACCESGNGMITRDFHPIVKHLS